MSMQDERYSAGFMMKDLIQKMRLSELKRFADDKGYELEDVLDGDGLATAFIPEFESWQQKKAKAEEEAERLEAERKAKEEWESFLLTIPARFRDASPSSLSDDFRKIYQELSEGKSGLLYGKNGPGKTYLAWCAAKDWKKRHETFAIEKGIETMSWIKSNFADGGDITRAIKAKYLPIRHLVIDEVDKIFETQADFVYLTYLIDIRYDEMLQTVIITNKMSEQEVIDSIGQSVYSRLTERGNIIYRFMNSVDRRRHPDGIKTGGGSVR